MQKQEHVKFHILLTSYETALPEATLLKNLEWESLVVDEGHRLRNKNSRLFQASVILLHCSVTTTRDKQILRFQ